jgi:hypothetical protein
MPGTSAGPPGPPPSYCCSQNALVLSWLGLVGLGLEAGQEGVDAELELVVGGDPNQVRALADHQVLHFRHYGHDSQQDLHIG